MSASEAGAPIGGAPALRRYEYRALGTWNVLLLADPDPADPARTDSASASAFLLLGSAVGR